MSYKPFRRILPRRERPEILALRDRLSARRVFRFISKYTNLPVGKELPLTAHLIIDVSVALDLILSAAPGQFYHLADNRDAILNLQHVKEPSAADVEKILTELRQPDRDSIVLDEQFIQKLADKLTWLSYERFIDKNLTNEKNESANGVHWRANAKFASGDLGGALEDYNRAIELEPDCATYLRTRAHLFTEQKRFAEAAADLLHAEKVSAERRDMLDSFHMLAELCATWSKLESMHETIAAAERFCRIAGKITLETEWDADGYGRFFAWYFPGARIVERIIQVRGILRQMLAGLVDRPARRQVEFVDQKLAGLEAMY